MIAAPVKSFSPASRGARQPVRARSLTVRPRALLGPDGKPSSGNTTTSGQKKITREAEPEQYWSSKAEASGNPMKDPLAIIGVVSIFLPFLLLLVAGATGLIDFSVYR